MLNTEAANEALSNMFDESRLSRSPDNWLGLLDGYQAIHGRGASPSKGHRHFDNLAQWLQRQRRMASHGMLPIALVAALAARHVPLIQDELRVGVNRQGSEASFARHLAALIEWALANRQADSGLAVLTWRASQVSRTATAHYRFLDHMRLRLRHGALTEAQREALQGVPLIIGSKPLMDWLVEPPVLRPQERLGADDGKLRQAWWFPINGNDLLSVLQAIQQAGACLYREGHGIAMVSAMQAAEGGLSIDIDRKILRAFVVGEHKGILRLGFGPGRLEGLLFRRHAPRPGRRKRRGSEA